MTTDYSRIIKFIEEQRDECPSAGIAEWFQATLRELRSQHDIIDDLTARLGVLQ